MKGLLAAVIESISVFRKHNCLDKAAAISFYAFFSLLPVMLLITSILGLVLGTHTGLLEKVIAMTRESLPYLGERIINDLKGLSQSWKTFGWLSLIILLWTAEMVFSAMADALLSIFEMEKSYGFFKRKLINFIVLLFGSVAALISVSITVAANVLLKSDAFFLRLFGISVLYHLLVGFLLRFAVPFVLMIVTVTFVYRIFSGPNLNITYSFYGSLLFVSLWEVAKQVFAIYIVNFPNYNKFYGSLGTVMMLLAWFYFSANIFLLSASFAAAAYKNRGR